MCACGVRICYDCKITDAHSCFDVEVEAAPLIATARADSAPMALAALSDEVVWLCPCCGLRRQWDMGAWCTCGIRICFVCDIQELHDCIEVEALPLLLTARADSAPTALAQVAVPCPSCGDALAERRGYAPRGTTCDGDGCGRAFRTGILRRTCDTCDFDLCESCALGWRAPNASSKCPRLQTPFPHALAVPKPPARVLYASDCAVPACILVRASVPRLRAAAVAADAREANWHLRFGRSVRIARREVAASFGERVQTLEWDLASTRRFSENGKQARRLAVAAQARASEARQELAACQLQVVSLKRELQTARLQNTRLVQAAGKTGRASARAFVAHADAACEERGRLETDAREERERLEADARGAAGLQATAELRREKAEKRTEAAEYEARVLGVQMRAAERSLVRLKALVPDMQAPGEISEAAWASTKPDARRKQRSREIGYIRWFLDSRAWNMADWATVLSETREGDSTRLDGLWDTRQVQARHFKAVRAIFATLESEHFGVKFGVHLYLEMGHTYDACTQTSNL